MTPQVREHAFEPFFTTKEVRRGSGLGLSMVYGFAKQSGGQVTLDSEVGRGTKVQLYLPRAEAPVAVSDAAPPESIVSGSGEAILVIEDDADVRQLAGQLLETLGYGVIAVADAAAAWEALGRGAAICLVLCDVVLPGGTSGPTFAAQLRKAHPGLPVIFMSGYPADDKGRERQLSADEVLLNKPFQRSVLAQAVRRALA